MPEKRRKIRRPGEVSDPLFAEQEESEDPISAEQGASEDPISAEQEESEDSIPAEQGKTVEPLSIEKQTDRSEMLPDTEQESLLSLSKADLIRGRRKAFRTGVITGVAAAVAASLVLALLPSALRSAGVHDSSLVADINIIDSTVSNKVNLLAAAIQKYYYKDVDTQEMQNAIYKGMMEDLDPYSTYLTAEEVEEYTDEDVEGTYAGIGAALVQDANTKAVLVSRVYEDSPAEKAGLKKGDYILKADDYTASEMLLDDFIKKLRGEAGTTVKLKYYRASTGKTYTKVITRENIDMMIVAHRMLRDHTGYILISTFNKNTLEQFDEAVSELQDQGMEKLIIDLRDNGGGLLQAACDVANRILPKGRIVYTQTKDGKKTYYNSDDTETLDLPIVVLVNGATASASEALAGALWDRGAAKLVGTTTYGKGIVQSVLKLTDGSAIKLTTSSYYTPSGICIHGQGLTPDYELTYQFLGGSDDTYSPKYDNQIQKAIKVLEKE